MVEASNPAPTLECDIVMRGGVTSGVVYPGAVTEIAKSYRLRSIGGTSAGAIAAAISAAMEFGRRSGRNPQSLDALSKIPAELGGKVEGQDGPFLLNLFAPDPPTKPLFDLAMAAKKPGGAAKALLGLLWWRLLIGGIVATAIVVLLAWWAGVGFGTILLAIPAWLSLVAASFALLFFRPRRLLNRVATAIRDNHYGLCSGMARSEGKTAGGAPMPSLSEWLHNTIQKVAGLPDDQPLTFGDLWIAEYCCEDREAAIAKVLGGNGGELSLAARDIDLTLVGTDLSRGLSLRFPFAERDGRLYARLTDLRKLLPETVVQWIERHKQPPEPGLQLEDPDFIRLPRAQDLPVLLGARISMSFPLLFSAVRLYTERWHGRRENRRGELIELWLADGGITSNFPIYLFDSPLPTRPTFCLNLVYAGEVLEEELRQEEGRSALPDATAAEGAARPQDLIFMPRSNYDRVLLHKPLAPEPAHSALAALLGRVVSTARLWGDNEAMNMPGYRDRIVHIRMREHEGGFNLDMGKEVIDDLTERGQAAGRMLAERFRPGAQSDPEDPQRPLRLNWSNHRFLRFRTFMAGLEVAGRRFAANWAKDRAAPQSLSAMLQKAYQEADLQSFPQYFGYRFRREEQADFARKATEAFLDLMQGWTTGSQPDLGFDPGGRAPRPKPGLRLRPAADGDPLADTPAVFAIEPDQDSPPGA